MVRNTNFVLQKYPKSVWCIVINELCERFSYYGFRSTSIFQSLTPIKRHILCNNCTNKNNNRFSAVLVLYLTTILKFNGDNSTIIYHGFVFLSYFMPLFGAILADLYWGKFKYFTVFPIIIFTFSHNLLPNIIHFI